MMELLPDHPNRHTYRISTEEARIHLSTCPSIQ